MVKTMLSTLRCYHVVDDMTTALTLTLTLTLTSNPNPNPNPNL